MGTLLNDEGVPVVAHLTSPDSLEIPKKLNIRVRIRLVEKPSEKRMHILLTSDDDASFFYFLDISETDYRTLRQRQGLLVDLSSFPSMLERLLDACRNEETSSSPKFLPLFTQNPSPDRTELFEIQEINSYRRLVHLSLEMCRGTDGRIREHLSERLSRCQIDYDKLSNSFRSLESEANAAKSETANLKNEVEKLRREKSEQESNFMSRLSSELTEERKRFQIELASIKSNYEIERRTLMEENSRSLRQLQNQSAALEYENKDLTEKKHRYEANIQTLNEEKRLQLEELSRMRRELDRHKEQNNYLGAGNHELDRNLNRLEAKVALLEQEKSRVLEDLNRQAQTIQEFGDQKKNLESELQEKKTLVTKREEAVKNVSRELLKANDVIKKLQEQNRKLNQKVKLGYDVLKEQERLLVTKDEELDAIRQELKTQNEKLSNLHEQIRKLEHSIEDHERKNNDLLKKNRTDEAVIQWLNKQLTFAQSRDPGLRLGPPPEFLATSTPLPAHLRDLGVLETPRNVSPRSTDKENLESQGLDPKYLRPSATGNTDKTKGISRIGSRTDTSVPSPTTAGLLRATLQATQKTLKSKNQQSVYFAET